MEAIFHPSVWQSRRAASSVSASMRKVDVSPPSLTMMISNHRLDTFFRNISFPFSFSMAGTVGFEPTNVGVKDRCLFRLATLPYCRASNRRGCFHSLWRNSSDMVLEYRNIGLKCSGTVQGSFVLGFFHSRASHRFV